MPGCCTYTAVFGGWRTVSSGTPCSRFRLNVWNVTRILILLVTSSLRLWWLVGSWLRRRSVLQAIPHLFLLDRIGDLGSVPKKVEISSDGATIVSALGAPTKGIVVQVISRLFKLVTEAIIGVFKVQATDEKVRWRSSALGHV